MSVHGGIAGVGTRSRQLFKILLHTIKVRKYMNIVKERAHRILTSDKAYRDEEVKYLRSVLKGIDQEELIRHLATLNYPELKAVVSCGIPGHAQSHALIMLKKKRDALDAYVSKGGIEANMETYSEDQDKAEEKLEENEEETEETLNTEV